MWKTKRHCSDVRWLYMLRFGLITDFIKFFINPIQGLRLSQRNPCIGLMKLSQSAGISVDGLNLSPHRNLHPLPAKRHTILHNRTDALRQHLGIIPVVHDLLQRSLRQSPQIIAVLFGFQFEEEAG